MWRDQGPEVAKNSAWSQGKEKTEVTETGV